jgi:hypothetical protein
MTSMSAKKRRTKWLAVTAMLVCIAGPAAANAGWGDSRSNGRGSGSPDATLYEVTETMYFYDALGALIPPYKILAGLAAPVTRVADATLQGTAELGTPLCPSKLLITNPKAKTCTVTAAGMDQISLLTGRGSVSGTYAVVLNIDNPTDAPEYVVQTGTFVGDMDLSMRPLGTIRGTFTPTLTTLQVPFSGTFRLPFTVDSNGQKQDVRRGVKSAYYLDDDGQTLIPVKKDELSLGTPLVRLELSF